MRYPGNLRDLDIHVESLTKGFMDGLRENAQSLQTLTITFNKIDDSVYEPFDVIYAREMKKKLEAEGNLDQKQIEKDK